MLLLVLVGGDDSNASTGNGANQTNSASTAGRTQHSKHTEHVRPSIRGLTPATVAIGPIIRSLLPCVLLYNVY
jgi:hypothetical protein